MWGGGFDGPCTAAYGPGGVVLVSGLPDYDGYFFDDVDAFLESPLSSAVEVCLTADLVAKPVMPRVLKGAPDLIN